MLRTKVTVAVFIAVLGLGGALSTTALAVEPYFKVTTGVLPVSETREVITSLSESKLVVPALGGVVIACKQGAGNGKVLNREEENKAKTGKFHVGGLKEATVVFEKCEAVNATECTINKEASGSAKITARGIAGKLGYKPGEANEKNVRLNITAESGLFATVKFGGASCSYPFEVFRITKGVVAEIPEAEPNKLAAAFKANLALKLEGGVQKQALFFIENPLLESGTVTNELAFGAHPAALETVATFNLVQKIGGEEFGIFTS